MSLLKLWFVGEYLLTKESKFYQAYQTMVYQRIKNLTNSMKEVDLHSKSKRFSNPKHTLHINNSDEHAV